MKRAVHTAMVVTFVGGIVLIALGLFFAVSVLELMGTPCEVMTEATRYLQIYFTGSLFAAIFNMGSGILRGVGDSKRPLYFLCVSSVVNIVLDLLFVAVFQFGVAGVAYATIIAQGHCAAYFDSDGKNSRYVPFRMEGTARLQRYAQTNPCHGNPQRYPGSYCIFCLM